MTVCAALAVVGLLAAACSGGGAPAPTRSAPPAGSVQAGASAVPGTSSSPAPAPVRLRISPATGRHDVRPGRVVTVAATGGTLRSVHVQAGGTSVAGRFDTGRRTWHSTAPLHVSSHYTVTATASNADGQAVTASSRFRTLTPTSTFSASIAQQAGGTYGVGMPIQVSFSQPIADKAAVEQALHITTSQPVVGAWNWLDDQHADFRPREYWPAHTRVSITAALDGVRAARGVYGTADVTRRFRIGASLIVVASTRTHYLHVYRDGRLWHTWPISTGAPGDDTPNGTYVTIEKANPVEMRPADIAPGQPGYYDLWVPWSVRFTWDGIYLHDAYWSVAQQGHVNVSHGCVNLPPAAAEAYYKLAVPGDPVTVTGSPVAGSTGNGWTDWFLSWSQLLAGSGSHHAVVAGPHGSRLVSPASVPPSTATAPLGRPAAHNAAAS